MTGQNRVDLNILQPLSEEDKAFMIEAYNNLDYFVNETQEYRDAVMNARDIMRLQDPDQDTTTVTTEETGTVTSTQNLDKPTMQLQTLKSTINNCVADQLQSIPDPKLLPEVPDKQALAEALQDIVRSVVYTTNNFERIHRRRVEDFYITGTAVTQIAWDDTMTFGKGDVAIIRWPIEAFLWDPQAEDIQDACALIKISWHPLSWYKDHYPDAGQYVQAENDAHNSVGIPRSQLNTNTKSEERAMLMEYWYRTFDGKNYHINVAYFAGYALLGKQENVYTHGMYPFVLDVHSMIEGQPVGDGLVSELITMMRYINRYAKYIDTNARLNSKGRILVRKDSGIAASDIANCDKDVIIGDKIEKGVNWDWMDGPQLSSTIFNQMMNMQAEMKQDSGANEISRGEPAGYAMSGKAYSILAPSAGKISQMRLATLNDGFGQMIWQILCLISQHYKADRYKRIVGDDKEYSFFKKGDQPKYTVQVEVKQKDPQRIDAQNQMFVQMFTMAAESQQPFPVSTLIEIMNFDGKDRVLPVVRAAEARTDRIKLLQEQNTQLIDQLTQMQKENDAVKQIETQAVNELASGGHSPTVNQGRQAVVK
jgi:hypothetical protein